MKTRRAGFTLVELMVALVIGAGVVLAAHTGLGAMVDARERTVDGGDATLSAAVRRSALEAWIATAVVIPRVPAFHGRRIRQGGLARDELTFVTMDAAPLGRGIHRVRLWVDLDPATAARGLVAELSPRTPGGFGPPRVVELEPGAEGLEARYLVSVDGRVRWVETWASDEVLPRAVSLRLVDGSAIRLGPGADSRSDLTPLLVLPLTVPVLAEST